MQRKGAPDVVMRTLARNRLGTLAVMFFVLSAAAPLTVVAGGATTGWMVTGVEGIPIAYVAIAVLLAVFSVGYTAMSRKIVNAGAFYSYIARGLGKMLGVSAASVALLAYNMMQIGLVGGFGAITAASLGHGIPWWSVALVGCVLCGVMGVARIDFNGWVLAAMLTAEIAIAVVYSLVEVAHPSGGTITFDTLVPARLLDSGIGAGFATAIAGFVGFEATAVYSEETKDPRRTVPRATYLALLVIGLLYAGASWAMSAATGPDHVVEQARDQGTELMFNLAGAHMGHAWITIGHFLFSTSLFAAMLAFHNTVARYTFALGREHVLPGFLGRTGARTNAPVWGSVLQTVLSLGAVIYYAAAGIDPIVKMFFWLTVTGGLGVLVLMWATSLAVVVFFARHPEHRSDVSFWSTAICPVLATVGLSWVLWLTVDQFWVLLGDAAPGSVASKLLPLSFLLVALVGFAWAIVLRVDNSGVFDQIGLGAEYATAREPAKQVTVPHGVMERDR